MHAFAEGPDRTASSFDQRKKLRIDAFDFSGAWPNLENIAIDGKRKRRVEIDLTGKYPLLESISYEGGFGTLSADLTGEFPLLETVDFVCGASKMTFDLRSEWQRNCTINIGGRTEDITLLLPTDVGLVVNTKVGAAGKVIVEGLKKRGMGILKKKYDNGLVETAEIVLQINVETSGGRIILSAQ